MLRFATRRRASRGDGSRWRKAKTVSVALEVPSAVSLVKQRAKTELFAAIDKDRSGAINHDEFLIFFLPIAPDHNSIIEWWTALAASSPASDCNEAAFVRWAENCPAQFEAAKQLVDRAAIARPREAQQLDSLLVSFEGAALVEDGSELGELGNVVAKLLVRLVDGRQVIGKRAARGTRVDYPPRTLEYPLTTTASHPWLSVAGFHRKAHCPRAAREGRRSGRPRAGRRRRTRRPTRQACQGRS